MQSSDKTETNKRRLYATLHVAEEDLRQASFFAAHILKKGWHFEQWEKRGTIYLQQAAFTTALATAYSRPFTPSRGWPKLPEKLIRPFDSRQKELHNHILELRNLIYAHSDVGYRGIRPFVINGYPTAIEALPPMRFTRDEILCIQSMISIAKESIGNRKVELISFAAGGA